MTFGNAQFFFAICRAPLYAESGLHVDFETLGRLSLGASLSSSFSPLSANGPTQTALSAYILNLP